MTTYDIFCELFRNFGTWFRIHRQKLFFDEI